MINSGGTIVNQQLDKMLTHKNNKRHSDVIKLTF